MYLVYDFAYLLGRFAVLRMTKTKIDPAGRSVRLSSIARIAPSLLAALLCGSIAAAAPQTIATGQVLRGHFVQDRQLKGFARPLRSEGSFVLVPGRGLIWRSEKPFSGTTVITSNGILQMSNGQEAMRLPASQLPGLSHLYEVLGAAVSGNIAPLQQSFSVIQSGDDAHWRITLTPLRPENPAMVQLKAVVLSGGHFVDAVEVDRTGDDIDRIAFSGQVVASAPPTAGEEALLGAIKK